MRQGFELLEIRSINSKINVESFEIANGLKLPPIYKVFIESFEIGTSGFKGEKFLHPNWGDIVDITVIQYLPNPDQIVVYEMFSIEKAFEVLESLYQDNSEVMRLKLLPIGECASNGMLMVGIDAKNQDQIFFEQPHSDHSIKLVAEDIFKFMRGLVQLTDEQGNIGKYKFSQLYKNWGENYWRIREETL